MAASAGTSDSATKEEISTATDRTKPNSRNSRPACEGRKLIGRNTDTSTAVVAITAKNTCRVPTTAAARRPSPLFWSRCVFSSTTIASSTMRPVARTSASNVSRLIEKPISQIPASTPISATGIVVLGIIVGRHARKNSSIVPTTTRMVKASVISTSRTETSMKSASSETTLISRSWYRAATRSTDARIALEIWIVFELAWRTTPSPTMGRPSSRTKLVASAGASVTSATSPTRVVPVTITSRMRSGSVALASARTTNSCDSERNDPTGTS